jgi:hypothetical protein
MVARGVAGFERLTVEFSGVGRRGPLTFAQANMVRTVCTQPPDEEFFLVSRILDLPTGVGLDDLVRAVTDLLNRHESLRTKYPPGDPAIQVVLGSGAIDIDVYRASAVGDLATAVRKRLVNRPIDVREELPVRLAAVVRDTGAVTVVIACSHVAVDYHALEIACRDLVTLASGHRPAAGMPPALQPLEVAATETATPPSVWAAAARHWESVLSSAPTPVFAVPRRPVGPPCGVATLDSVAVSVATQMISRRVRATASSAVLAAVAALAGFITANHRCLITSLASNRFTNDLRGYVGNLYQDAVLELDVRTGTFDDAVRRAFGATAHAYRHSRFNAEDVWNVIAAVAHRRGTHYWRDLVFNDTSRPEVAPAGAVRFDRVDVEAAGKRSRRSWQPATDTPARCYLGVHRMRPIASLVLRTDTRFVPRPVAEEFLSGLERLLVAAAFDRMPLTEVGAVSGVTSIERGSDWHLVDSCWIDLMAVRSLLSASCGGRPSSAFVEDIGSRPTLVAFVAGGRDLSPDQLHAKCVQRLPEFDGAIAPQRYVICTQAPADPDARHGWLACETRAEGTGR